MKNLGKLSLGILLLLFIGEVFVSGITPAERTLILLIFIPPILYIYQTLRK